MSDNPIYDNLVKQIEPLTKAAERMGAMRALLTVAQHIEQRIAKGTLKNTYDVKLIVEDLECIRKDIYKADAVGQQGNG